MNNESIVFPSVIGNSVGNCRKFCLSCPLPLFGDACIEHVNHGNTLCYFYSTFFRSDWDSQDSQVTHEDTSTTTGSSSLAGGTKWSLECSTVEEWNVLADSLKNSRDANEKGLLSILVNQFLDRIAEMIEAKVDDV